MPRDNTDTDTAPTQSTTPACYTSSQQYQHQCTLAHTAHSTRAHIRDTTITRHHDRSPPTAHATTLPVPTGPHSAPRVHRQQAPSPLSRGHRTSLGQSANLQAHTDARPAFVLVRSAAVDVAASDLLIPNTARSRPSLARALGRRAGGACGMRSAQPRPTQAQSRVLDTPPLVGISTETSRPTVGR